MMTHDIESRSLQETRDHERTARDLGELSYAAYAKQASGSLHSQHEQALPTPLVEALTPAVNDGSAQGAVEAASAVRSVFEQVEPDIRGPRVQTRDLDTTSVTLAANP